MISITTSSINTYLELGTVLCNIAVVSRLIQTCLFTQCLIFVDVYVLFFDRQGNHEFRYGGLGSPGLHTLRIVPLVSKTILQLEFKLLLQQGWIGSWSCVCCQILSRQLTRVHWSRVKIADARQKCLRPNNIVIRTFPPGTRGGSRTRPSIHKDPALSYPADATSSDDTVRKKLNKDTVKCAQACSATSNRSTNQ